MPLGLASTEGLGLTEQRGSKFSEVRPGAECAGEHSVPSELDVGMRLVDCEFNQPNDIFEMNPFLWVHALLELGSQFCKQMRNLALIEDRIAPRINELNALRLGEHVPTFDRKTSEALTWVEDLLLRLPVLCDPSSVDAHAGYDREA
jgi:hypothetical protein